MNFSPITDDLFIGNTPFAKHYDQLHALGVRLIINMRFSRGLEPDSHDPPINVLWLRTIDSPLFPIPIYKLMRGAQAALDTIHCGGKVYVHCAYGRHRSVAMGACILIAQGMPPNDAMQLIESRRSVADPEAFYIKPRILMFAERWQKTSSVTA